LELSIKQHLAKVEATCFDHLRRLRQIRRRVRGNYANRIGFHHIAVQLL